MMLLDYVMLCAGSAPVCSESCSLMICSLARDMLCAHVMLCITVFGAWHHRGVSRIEVYMSGSDTIK